MAMKCTKAAHTFGVLDQMEFSGTVRILSQCSCFSRLRCVMLACTCADT